MSCLRERLDAMNAPPSLHWGLHFVPVGPTDSILEEGKCEDGTAKAR